MRTRGISPAVAAALLIIMSIVAVLIVFVGAKGSLRVGGTGAKIEVVPGGIGSSSGNIAVINVHIKNTGGSPALIEEIDIINTTDGSTIASISNTTSGQGAAQGCTPVVEPADIIGRTLGAKESADIVIRLTGCHGLYNGKQLIISVKYKDVNTGKEDYNEKMFKLS